MANRLNRRDFLGLSAAGLGLLTLSGGAGAAERKALVAYASRCGSTADIARAIADDLNQRGFAVTMQSVAKAGRVAGYDAVVLGSAVRYGHWLPEAVDFVRAHASELKRVPTAFFTVHMMNTGQEEASRKARLGYLEPVHAIMRPNAEIFFAGRMDMSRLSFTERLLCKVMKGHDADLRDWAAIHAWGRTVLS